MPSTIAATLRQLEALLAGPNYHVAFRYSDVAVGSQEGLAIIVERALGEKASVGGSLAVDPASVWPTVEGAILWTEGGAGVGPAEGVIGSDALARVVQDLRVRLDRVVWDAASIHLFWLDKGHPHYPVYWDFAYVFIRPERASVFLGSSSD